ncbi:hypothetical protein ACHAP5_010321 [Fusarium lateritium]
MRSSHHSNTSLHKLTVDNPWFSAHPLSWTADHLKLVGCEFSLIDTHTHLDTATASAHDQHLMRHGERLAKCRTASIRYVAAQELLCQEGGPLRYIEGVPSFSFAANPFHHPECLVLCPTATSVSDDKTVPLMAGYIHYEKVKTARERFLTPIQHPVYGYNLPVYRIYERKREHITPKTWDEDPYLACILLSLSQLLRNRSEPRATSYSARLLVTKQNDKTHAHIYHTEIPEVILNNLDHPSHDLGSIWPKIYHARIPLEPYQTLGSRITRLLSPEYVFVKPTTGATLRASKRKHHDDETQTESCSGGMARKKMEL